MKDYIVPAIIVVLGVFIIGFAFGVELNLLNTVSDVQWDIVIGFSSLIIASLAFLVTIFNSYSVYKFNLSTVRPLLTFWYNQDLNTKTYEYLLRNNGSGPALIRKFDYYIDGIKIEGKALESADILFETLFPKTEYQYKSSSSYVGPEYVIKKHEEISLLLIQFDLNKAPTEEEIEKAGDRVDTLIEYESIYGEKNKLDTREIKERHPFT